ncbi:folylpolyglutamate synthase/dihydrofolate synthase family protein [Cyanobacterium sp. Dongsha4]|uniref:bifunctional folylpolyglutamate synthase/dihydrofolate synthase n=1 Tax=Cyanobacterium sp. DS4 TaxID=2878255 RepID=UPI002E81BA81|nr:folylpolyglutamate synthase/dihydrofolate synthase family protein [Cyanobacterium sp. Dongsha4]WVK99753.1 bifunctional folylpolyglutamate synthase/dihydrofolate synthase [Cyanobacterium sp. Dongsha4]
MGNQIEDLLQPFQRFGINLGLKRIKNLLALLDNPQEKVPIIHVAGTNGKGSVCAYLSSILTASGYKTGRYTSPHLVNWTERICLNEKPIEEDILITILEKIRSVINPNDPECPTQFEVITAAAWLFFANSEVDVAVMEVGLGGRLDATNVCDRSLASIITSISREHWQRLGDTLSKIATEKAGVIKEKCPAVVGNLPEEAVEVVKNRAEELNAPTIWVKSAQKLSPNQAEYEGVNYPLALAGDIQLQNSAIAIATIKILQEKGWQIPTSAIEEGMKNTRWRGRIEWVKWQQRDLLIDGAHNVASAKVLRQYVDTLHKPTTWVMGMLNTKDHEGIFKQLLRPEDQLHLVPVPDHSTAEPEELAILAKTIQPQLKQVQTYGDLYTALDSVTNNQETATTSIVLCGSLYLLGYFLGKLR